MPGRVFRVFPGKVAALPVAFLCLDVFLTPYGEIFAVCVQCSAAAFLITSMSEQAAIF